MQEIKWVLCPECKKRLCKIKTEPENTRQTTLYLWCKQCRKEVEVKVHASYQNVIGYEGRSVPENNI